MSVNDSPENTQSNRKRLRAVVVKALRGSPLASPDAVVDMILAERDSLRETIAAEILEPLIDRYEGGLNNDQMETLVWVVRHFVRAPDGEIVLDKPPPNARKRGLRSI